MRERVDAEDAALGFESFLRDARYAVRGFVKSPGFTIVAVLTLALGIGANTAVFQLLDAVRLRSLPVQNPQELAELRIAGGNTGLGINDSPFANFTIPDVAGGPAASRSIFRRDGVADGRHAGGQAERREAGAWSWR